MSEASKITAVRKINCTVLRLSLSNPTQWISPENLHRGATVESWSEVLHTLKWSMRRPTGLTPQDRLKAAEGASPRLSEEINTSAACSLHIGKDKKAVVLTYMTWGHGILSPPSQLSNGQSAFAILFLTNDIYKIFARVPPPFFTNSLIIHRFNTTVTPTCLSIFKVQISIDPNTKQQTSALDSRCTVSASQNTGDERNPRKCIRLLLLVSLTGEAQQTPARRSYAETTPRCVGCMSGGGEKNTLLLCHAAAPAADLLKSFIWMHYSREPDSNTQLVL